MTSHFPYGAQTVEFTNGCFGEVVFAVSFIDGRNAPRAWKAALDTFLASPAGAGFDPCALRGSIERKVVAA